MPAAIGIIMVTTLAVAVVTDIRSRRIPNWLTITVAVTGLALHGLNQGGSGVLTSFEGWVLAVAVLMFPFLLGWLGAGDVKLMAALGALQGPEFVLATCVFTALFGGVVVAVPLVRERKLQLALTHLLFAWWVPTTPEAALLTHHRTPYAPAIALGALAALIAVP